MDTENLKSLALISIYKERPALFIANCILNKHLNRSLIRQQEAYLKCWLEILSELDEIYVLPDHWKTMTAFSEFAESKKRKAIRRTYQPQEKADCRITFYDVYSLCKDVGIVKKDSSLDKLCHELRHGQDVDMTSYLAWELPLCSKFFILKLLLNMEKYNCEYLTDLLQKIFAEENLSKSKSILLSLDSKTLNNLLALLLDYSKKKEMDCRGENVTFGDSLQNIHKIQIKIEKANLRKSLFQNSKNQFKYSKIYTEEPDNNWQFNSFLKIMHELVAISNYKHIDSTPILLIHIKARRYMLAYFYYVKNKNKINEDFRNQISDSEKQKLESCQILFK